MTPTLLNAGELFNIYLLFLQEKLAQATAPALFSALDLRAAWLYVYNLKPWPTSLLRAVRSWLYKADRPC